MTEIPLSDGDLRTVSCISPSSNIPDACSSAICYSRGFGSIPVFDMAYSDSDSLWTVPPELPNHVRAVGFNEQVDIILDSGADGSVLHFMMDMLANLSNQMRSCILLTLKEPHLMLQTPG